MTTKEQMLAKFDEEFCKERICKACLLKDCDHSTTGCPWYQDEVFLNQDGGNISTKDKLKSFLSEVWNEAEKAGRESVFEEIEHDRRKLLDGFGHPKDCEFCKNHDQ